MQVQSTDGRRVLQAEVRDILEGEQTDRKEELSYEQKLALEHAKIFGRLPTDQAKALLKEIKALNAVSDELAVKIVDTLPTHPDDLRGLFHKEKTNLSKEQLDKIIELVLSYKK
jgi:DNA-directed RNA polymerase subunit F